MVGSRGSNCVTMPNFVLIGLNVAEIWRSFYFSKMDAVHHLGFVGRVWTIHERHLEVFITLQNLAGIDAVVSIIYTFFELASLA